MIEIRVVTLSAQIKRQMPSAIDADWHGKFANFLRLFDLDFAYFFCHTFILQQSLDFSIKYLRYNVTNDEEKG